MAGDEHKRLVEVAIRWLKYHCTLPLYEIDGKPQNCAAKCAYVVSEIVTAANEVPDALGWYCGTSVAIEVKVSRSDYYRDKQKIGRRHEQHGIGDYRFYMTPAGLLVQKNLPKKWGLLEVTGNKVSIVKIPEKMESSQIDEKRILLSVIRRLLAKESAVA